MSSDTVAIHPRKARHLGTSLLEAGNRLVASSTHVQALLAAAGDDPTLVAPVLEAGAWAAAEGVRVLATAARVEAWDAEGRLPSGVSRWDQPWDGAFASPGEGHRAAATAIAAWRGGDRELFLRTVGHHGDDAVFAATLLAALDTSVVVEPFAERWLGLTGRPADPGDVELTGALGHLLATASSVGIGPRPAELVDGLAAAGAPAAALGLLVADQRAAGHRFETSWLVELGVAVLPVAGAAIAAGGDGGRLGASSPGAELLPDEWAGDLRVPVLEAIAADPAASARLLAGVPLATLLPAAAEVPAAGLSAAAVVRSAARASEDERAAAATAVITSIGREGGRYQDGVLVAAVGLVEPYLDALRPAEYHGGDHPEPSLPVAALDAERFVATVAASDRAAEALAAATSAWVERELPVITALPEQVLRLRLLGGTAGMIVAGIEAGRCDRADLVDDDREHMATLATYLGTLVSAFAPGPGTGLVRSGLTTWLSRSIDPGVDHADACRADLQYHEAVRATVLGLWVVESTWANRGANGLFTTEGGTVPPPPRAVLDPTGDHLLAELDGDQLRQLAGWLRRSDVAEGLPGIDAFIGRFAAAAPPRGG